MKRVETSSRRSFQGMRRIGEFEKMAGVSTFS
jgi:hypothetical protein